MLNFGREIHSMGLLIKNIKYLVHCEENIMVKYSGNEMSSLKFIENAYVFIENDRIKAFGTDGDARMREMLKNDQDHSVVDANQGCVFPSWCDSHTHLVYAGSRENEFVDRLKGLTYEEIAQRGGGILQSAQLLRRTSEDDLYEGAKLRLNEILHSGTGAVEIKSGYGLDHDSEIKMLRVIRRLKENSSLTIRSTFLGAHAIPGEYKGNRKGYLDYLIHGILPDIAAEKLADYCDIFCERNYFSPEDALLLFEAAGKYGLIPKVHAEQLSHSGGIQAGVRSSAISVDHLEFANADDINVLKASSTMPVLLPGAQFFLGLKNPPVREMIQAGLPVALSSDFNPGSCPSGNMNLMVSLACILYKLTPDEAILAATTNSAYAIHLSKELGSIAIVKKANLFITRPIPSYSFLPYSFGSNLIDKVILNGKLMDENSY
jgi:imidazolonepropionase